MHASLPTLVRKNYFVMVISLLIVFSVTTVAFAAIASGSFMTAASTQVTSTHLKIAKPTVSVGDFMLASIAVHGGSAATISTIPSGWTEIARTNNDTNISLVSYWKIASGSEPGNYTWVIDGQTTGEGGITVYSGVDATSPIDQAAGNSGYSAIATTPSITTSGANEQVVDIFAVDEGKRPIATRYFSTPVGMTEKYDVSNPPYGPSIALDEVTQAAPGTVAGKSSTISGGNKPRKWAAQQIALRQQAQASGIAFDSATRFDSVDATTTYSFSHTVTGSNPILWAAVFDADSGGGDRVTGVTYDGVALTRVAAVTSGCANTPPSFLYMLVGPATGTHTIEITADSVQVTGAVASYTGARQSGQPDAVTTNIACNSSGGLTTTLATNADNSWMVSGDQNWNVGPYPGAGITTRTSPPTNGWYGDSNGPIHPAGNYSMTWSPGSGFSLGEAVVQASFAPAI